MNEAKILNAVAQALQEEAKRMQAALVFGNALVNEVRIRKADGAPCQVVGLYGEGDKVLGVHYVDGPGSGGACSVVDWNEGHIAVGYSAERLWGPAPQPVTQPVLQPNAARACVDARHERDSSIYGAASIFRDRNQSMAQARAAAKVNPTPPAEPTTEDKLLETMKLLVKKMIPRRPTQTREARASATLERIAKHLAGATPLGGWPPGEHTVEARVARIIADNQNLRRELDSMTHRVVHPTGAAPAKQEENPMAIAIRNARNLFEAHGFRQGTLVDRVGIVLDLNARMAREAVDLRGTIGRARAKIMDSKEVLDTGLANAP